MVIFANLMTYSTGNQSGPWGISVGDFNNDHRSDIVVANSNTNNIGVFLGYGNGTFYHRCYNIRLERVRVLRRSLCTILIMTVNRMSW